MDASKGSHEFPVELRKRFEWLPGGDVKVQERLLQFVLDKERQLSAESLFKNLPILQAHLRSAQGQNTHAASQQVNFGKNRFTVELTDRVAGITEISPNGPEADSEEELSWRDVVGLCLLLLFVFTWIATVFMGD